MAYVSDLFVHNPETRTTSAIRNGSPAFAGYAQAIAKNQHWLALTDTPFVNCLNGQYTSTGNPHKIVVEVPPFCNYAELAFWCVGSITRVGAAAIVATADNDSVINDVPGSSTSLSRERAGWVFMNSPDDESPNSPNVLRLAAAPSETWTTAEIEIVLDTNVHLYIAHYRVIPAVYYSVA